MRMVPSRAIFLCAIFYFLTIANAQDGSFTNWASATQSNFYKRVYTTEGTAAETDLSCYQVLTGTAQYPLGSVCVQSLDPPTFYVWVVKFTSSKDITIAFPLDYLQIWSDESTSSKTPASFWRPICPGSYVAMGHYAQSGYSKPDLQAMVCMSATMTGQGHLDQVWISNGIPSISSATMWSVYGMYYLIVSAPATYVAPNKLALSFYPANSCPGHPECMGLGDCNAKTGECRCYPGFGGPLCQDINECALPTPPCDPCRCNNTVGSYICHDPLTFTVVVTNPSCTGSSDGRIIVNAKGGGSGEYIYDYGRGKTIQGYSQSLPAGTYYVNVWDTYGCQAKSQVVILNEPRILTASAVTTNALCHGTESGSLTITGFGGTGIYTYQIDAMPYQYSNKFPLSAGTHLFTIKDEKFCSAKGYKIISEPSAIVVKSSHTDATCFNSSTGTITVTATGGTGAFTYRIEPNYTVGTNKFQSSSTFTGLRANLYQVTVQDANGCQVPTVQTITQPAAPLLLKYTLAPISCNGKKDAVITAFASGGLPPYQYTINGTWQDSNVFSPLSPGTYTIQATDTTTCVTTVKISVTQPLVFSSNVSTASTTPTQCMGDLNGQMTLASYGGTTPYSYTVNGGKSTFSSSFTNLVAGAYAISAIDSHGCTVPNYTLSVSGATSQLTATSYIPKNISCHGGSDGSLNVVPSGGVPPYQCSINSASYRACNFTSLPAYTYAISILDAYGCVLVIDQPATLKDPPVLSVFASVTSTVSCNGLADGAVSVTADGGTPPYVYTLSKGSTALNSTTGQFTGLLAGIYTVSVTDSNQCQTTASATAHVTQPEILSISTSYTIPPCDSPSGTITATATGGTPKYQFSINGNATSTGKFGGLTQGNYTVIVNDSNSCSAQQTVIVKLYTNDIVALAYSHPVRCYGGNTGSITVSATGSYAPFQYQINENSFNYTNSFPGLHPGLYYITVKDAAGCLFTINNVLVTQPRKLVVTPRFSAPLCFNTSTASLSVTATGGTAPYNYSFNGLQTTNNSMAVGPYAQTAIVTDSSGCQASTQVYIPNSAPIVIKVSTTPIRCFGETNGQASVAVSGGRPPYSISIDGNPIAGTTLGNLAAGTYTVSVADASSCVLSQTFEIAGPLAALSISANATNITCESAHSIVRYKVFGGKGLYNVSLTPDTGYHKAYANYGYYKQVPEGDYNLQVQDGYGCVAQLSFSLHGPAPMIVTGPKKILTGFVPKSGGIGLADASASFIVSGGSYVDYESFFLVANKQNATVCSSDVATTNTPTWTKAPNANVTVSSTPTFTGLAAGTLTLFAFSEGNCLVRNNYSLNVVTPTPPLQIPFAPVLSVDLFNKSTIMINWTIPENGDNPITNYDIAFFRPADCLSDIPPNANWSHYITSDTDTYYSFDVAYGDCYYIRVAGINDVGTGPFSLDNFVIAARAPFIPTNLKMAPFAVLQGYQSIAIQWVAPPVRPRENLVYQLEVRTEGGTYSTVANNLTNPAFLLNLTTAGVRYYSRVRAINLEFGYPGSYSLESSVVSIGIPGVPENVVSSVVPADPSACLIVNWTRPADMGHDSSAVYVIQLSNNNGKTWNTQDNSACPTCTSFSICSGLIYATPYSVRLYVQGFYTGDLSQNTTVRYGLLPNPPSNLVGVVSVALTQGTADFTWEASVANGPLTTYYVLQQLSPNGALSEVYRGTDLTFTLPGLTAGDKNKYILRATNGMGDSQSINISLPIAAAPAKPSQYVLLGNVTLQKFTASLNASLYALSSVEAQGSPITGYSIAVLVNGQTTLFNVPINAISNVQLDNLTAGATAIVSYAGCNIVGCGKYSETESVYLATVPPRPAAPVGFVIALNATEQSLEIDFTPDPETRDGNITSYYIMEYSNNYAPIWKQIEVFNLDPESIPMYNLTYKVPVLKYGVSHMFRVRAVNGIGTSEPSNYTLIRVVNPPSRPAITSLVLAVKDNWATATLNWHGDEVAGGYQVYYTRSDQLNWTLSGSTPLTRWGFSNLTIGVEYQIQIRPYISLENGVPVDFGPPSETYVQDIGVAPYDDVTYMQPEVLGYSDDLIYLAWNQASNTGLQNYYNLYYSVFDPMTDDTVPSLRLVASNLTSNQYGFTNITKQRYYQFAVKAVNSIGAGDTSLVSDQIYTGDVPTVPFAVVVGNFVQLDDGTVSADVSWNQTGTDVMSFLVSYTYGTNTWTNVKTGTTVVSLLQIPLGVKLTVRVLAVNPRGNSEFSPNTTATTAVTPGAMLRPGKPAFVVLGATSKVNVFWKPITFGSDITYKLEHAIYSRQIEASGSYVWVTDISSYTGLNYTVTLQTSQQYVFRTTAHSSAGNGIPSAPSVPVFLAEAPYPSKNTKYNIQDSFPLGVSIQFSPGDDRGSPIQYFYATYTLTPYKNPSVTPVTGTVMIPAGNQTLNASLPAYNGWSYNIQIFAVNAIGTGSAVAMTFFLAIAPRNPPTAPYFGVVTVLPGHIADVSAEFTVDYSDTGVDSLIIESSRDQHNWTTYATMSTLKTSSNLTSSSGACAYIPYSTVIDCVVYFQLPSGYMYYVRARAGNAYGKSQPGLSNALIAAVAPAISPSFTFNTTAIDIGSFSVGDGMFNWTTVEDDGGNIEITWTIEYTLNPLMSGPYTLMTITNEFFYNVHSLTIGQSYYLRVTPSGLGGRGSPYFTRFIPAIRPDVIGKVNITDSGDFSQRIQFKIPNNGGIYLFSFTIETTEVDVYNVSSTFNRTFPSTYADLLPNYINSILMPCSRGKFYSYRVYATNAAKLSARSFSNYSESYFAAFYILRKISPTYNTIKAGALVTLKGDTIPWTQRFICNFNGVISMGIPDNADLNLAHPICKVPVYPETGVIQFTVSTDGYQWSPAFDFEYHGYPVVAKVYPVSSLLKGNTPIIVSGQNLEWTQSVRCYFGDVMVEGTYSVTKTSVRCPAPQSMNLSPPTTPMFVQIDYNPMEYQTEFWYYVQPTLTTIFPNSFEDTPGKSVFINGGTFYETGTLPLVRFSSSYGAITQSVRIADSGTAFFTLAPLPGASSSWLVDLSFDGGYSFSNQLSISVRTTKISAQCKQLDCTRCFMAYKDCTYAKQGTYGVGWCHSKFSGGDPSGPTPATDCSGFYFTSKLYKTPQDLFISPGGDSITYVIAAYHTIHTHVPGVKGPLEVITCQGTQSWMPVSAPINVILSGGKKFAPYRNYNDYVYFQCYFTLPINTPLYETKQLGFNYQFYGQNLDWSVYQDFTLKPYAQILYTTQNNRIPTFLQTFYYGEDPWMLISIVGTDFLSSVRWENGKYKTECDEACDMQINVRDQDDPGSHNVKLFVNNLPVPEDVKPYSIFPWPSWAQNMVDFFTMGFNDKTRKKSSVHSALAKANKKNQRRGVASASSKKYRAKYNAADLKESLAAAAKDLIGYDLGYSNDDQVTVGPATFSSSTSAGLDTDQITSILSGPVSILKPFEITRGCRQEYSDWTPLPTVTTTENTDGDQMGVPNPDNREAKKRGLSYDGPPTLEGHALDTTRQEAIKYAMMHLGRKRGNGEQITYWDSDSAKQYTKRGVFKTNEDYNQHKEGERATRGDDSGDDELDQLSNTQKLFNVDENCDQPVVGFVINFPFIQINNIYEIYFKPIDGEYGAIVKGNFSLLFSLNGEMLTQGSVIIKLCAKNCAGITIAVSCAFVIENNVVLHDCNFTIIGELKFFIPIPLDEMIGIPLEAELMIHPTISATIHLIKAEYDVQDMGYDVGNDLNVWASGTLEIEVGIGLSIGYGPVGIQFLFTVKFGVDLQIAKHGGFIQGITVGGGFQIQLCFFLCLTVFKIEVEIHLDLTRSQQLPGMASDYTMIMGNWPSYFNHDHVLKKRLAPTSTEPVNLIEEVYYANNMKVFAMTADKKALALGVFHFNSSLIPGSALTLVYSIYSHDSLSFTEPKAYQMAPVADGTPTAILYNSTSYLVVWTRTSEWNGTDTSDPNQLLKWQSTAGIVYAFYNIEIDAWSEAKRITPEASTKLYFSPNGVLFTDPNGKQKVMLLFSADLDGNIYTSGDTFWTYTVFDGSTFSTPVTTSYFAGLGGSTIAVCDGIITFGFTTTKFEPFAQAYIAPYTVSTGSWGALQRMSNSPTEMAYAFDGDGNKVTAQNVTDTDIQIVVHERQFLVAWNRAKVLLYKIWSPSSNPEPTYVYANGANIASSWISLVTFGSGTNTDPQYTALVSQSTQLRQADNASVSVKLIQPKTTTFGASIDFVINMQRPWDGSNVLLAPPIDPSSSLPSLVHIWTDELAYKDPATNASYKINPILWYRVVDIKANVSVSRITFKQLDAETVMISVTVQNYGLVSAASGATSIVVKEGTLAASNGALIVEYSLPFLSSGASYTFTAIWEPGLNFAGYVHASTLTVLDGTVSNPVSVPQYIPLVQSPEAVGLAINGSAFVKVTFSLSTIETFPTHTNLTVPVSIYQTPMGTDTFVFIQKMFVEIAPLSTEIVEFDLPQESVKGSLSIVAGVTDLPIKFASDFSVVNNVGQLVVTTSVELVLTDSTKVTVLNKFATTFVASVSVTNAATFSTNGTVSMYITDFVDIPTNNSFDALQNLTNRVELIASTTTFIPGTGATEFHISASLPGGTYVYCFVVSTNSTESSTMNNAVCTSLTLYSLADLHVDTSTVAADLAGGSVTFVVYNFVTAAVTNVVLPVYQKVDAETSALLGYTNPFNISGSALQFAKIEGLSSLFSAVSNLYLFNLRVDVPAQYTSDFVTKSTTFGLARASTATIPTTLVPNKPLYIAYGLVPISSQVVHVHDNITIPVVVTKFDSSANTSFNITVFNLPQYFQWIPNDYLHTGQAFINFYVSDSVPLDENTHGAQFDNITVALFSQTGTILASVTFSITVSACPVGYETCKNFACALEGTCGINSLMCPLSKPTLIGATCMPAPINQWKYTKSIDVKQHNVLALDLVGATINIPAGALRPYGNMSFTALELAGWVHNPFAFDSSSEFEIEEEKALLSAIVSIKIIDTTVKGFNKPVTITYQAWWDESAPLPDLNYYCLAVLNATNNWNCAPNSSLILPAARGKRDGTSHAQQIQATTSMPGSYALFVNPNPPAIASYHKRSRGGEIAGIVIGVLAFVGICVCGAYVYFKKPLWAIKLKSKAMNLRRPWTPPAKNINVELAMFTEQREQM